MKITLNETEKKVFRIVLDVAKKHNITLRVAGGWVRDKALGKESHDIDIAVDGKIDGKDVTGAMFAKLVAEKTGQSFAVVKANPDQSKHLETATIKVEGMDIDFVHLRNETYGNSRIPQVKPGTPDVDALRRDLTINSLFYNINNGKIEDFTGKGVNDLQHGIIRTPLAAEKTLKDDPLRALRAIRFASRFGFKVDDQLMEAMKAPSVKEAFEKKISVERITSELNKMMKTNPVVGLRLLVKTGLLDKVFPELGKLDFNQKTKWHDKTVLEHTLHIVAALHKQDPNDIDMKWAAVFHDIAKPNTATPHKDGVSLTFIGHELAGAKMTRKIMEKLRFSNDRIDRVTRLVARHMIAVNPKWSDFKIKRWLRKNFKTPQEVKDVMRLRGADIDALNPKHNRPIKELHDAAVKRLAEIDIPKVLSMKSLINGHEIQKLYNKKPGTWIKDVQAKLIDMQLQDIVTTKAEAIERVKKWISKQKK